MHTVGNGRSRPIGLVGPTDNEIQASVENSKLAPCAVAEGRPPVRTHAEANVADDRWTAEAMA
jgi:hypothetical protein